MKRSILLVLFFLAAGLYTANAQWGDSTSELSSGKDAAVKWDKKNVDLGKVKYNRPVEVIFTMTNTGGKPIIITKAKTSCGCTDAEYPIHPIAPGKKAKIAVTYEADDIGMFNKTITLTMNIEQSSQVLHITGEVVK